MSYLILCKQRKGDLALWWRPNRAGYTVNLLEAGRYTKDEAESIAQMRGEDYPVHESDLGGVLLWRRVISVEDGENFKTLKKYERAIPPTDPRT